MLVDALRESQTPTDEDVIYDILGALLVSPVISVQAEKKKYHELLRDNGYVSVPALQRLTAEKLVVMGVSMGHAGLVLAALFRQEGVTPAEGKGHHTGGRSPQMARIGAFAGLGVTGYPLASTYKLYKPKLTAHNYTFTRDSSVHGHDCGGAEGTKG